ncbi:FkbM family methyltransferase [Saccharolobus solfataricus]|uniref:Methyltransferase FkbM domain-containing protein n=3 Tax=Saccharolobus solfataricus TaxID=2287 RepID=Q97XG4_SACS2|nr:FkbM family methyltransferase [Saccharolobus solfataricus]AAK41970.1 Conserved hypothetical protein [Saccharolobus solfataricus P2]AKA74661.1 FkbM family methyltransferase [Saccharolobus solfataricus]AKA77355.1 FkbM family methyltransferase [Saccharolobus solfataricus]AKA80046.1 FkbM family methyltransferase [Saccharolobus solfataricus]AZF69125.1 FkbM family methyltransferase [Saccharolobus solfataricus]
MVFPNGFSIKTDRDNFHDILNLYLFSYKYGVDIGSNWKFDEKYNILITPSGIKFSIKGFDPVIFSETFLYDIHFIDYNLENKKIIQAGAYVGETALYYAKRGAYVYAFEPQLDCYNIALTNLKLNPELASRVVLRNWAIGEDGEIEFPNTRCNGGTSYFDSYKDRIRVRSVSISTVLEEFNISQPDILDLDIKGGEFRVINDKSIQKFSIVRIEYNTVIDNKKLGDVTYLIEKLRSYGFTKIRIYKHNELPFDLSINGVIEARK